MSVSWLAGLAALAVVLCPPAWAQALAPRTQMAQSQDSPYRYLPSGPDSDELRRFAERFEWHLAAARGGAADGQYAAGVVLYYGWDGIPHDHAAAIDWLRRASEGGHPRAPYALGLVYDLGDEAVRDQAKATRWFRVAARRGDPDGLFALAKRQKYGEGGVTPDIAKALTLYRRAAEAGSYKAQLWLGQVYRGGMMDVEPDPREARRWFRAAVEQGSVSAIGYMGDIYRDKKSELYDPVEALKWYLIFRAEGGHPNFLQGIDDKLRTNMTAGQAAEAERRAEDWLAARKK